MTIERFRTIPTKSSPARVDRENRVIYGVSCAQAVEALGHRLILDNTTLQQLAEHGNAKKGGIKSRFTHPGLSADGLGKYLGRLKDFGVEGDKVLADLHLSDLASKSPDGDLAAYVMDLAEEDPEAFGMSVVIDTRRVWQLEDGGEVETEERPKNATTKMPLARIENFIACDAVDEPAANRDGMFSSALWATNQLSEQVFGEFDTLLDQYGFTPEKAWDFALKYFSARDIKTVKELRDMSKNQTETQAAPVADDVQAQLAAVQEQLAQFEAERAEANARAQKLEEALDASNRHAAELETKARNKRYAELSAAWFGNNHVAVLAALAEAAGEDSELFTGYVEQQNAMAAQMADSALFKSMGSDKTDEGRSAAGRLEAKAAALMAENPSLTKAQATVLAAEQNKDLYNEYLNER